jgi:hypothetical protein
LIVLAIAWLFFGQLESLYLWFTEYGIGFLLPIVAGFALLKKLENTKKIMAATDFLRQFRRRELMDKFYFPLAGIGMFGTALAEIHLRYFDPLFREAGSIALPTAPAPQPQLAPPQAAPPPPTPPAS